ncbi:MAG: FAD-binding oxidoreductase, partial [Deltaproteobacteria bacterium]
MNEFRRELEAELGSAVTFDPQQTKAYDHDLGEMPSVLMAQIRPVPDAVLAARSPEQVASALRIAARHGVPVTPRGQASSGFGGAIPTRGGLLVDLTPMNAVLGIDPDAGTVDVQPGVVWNALSARLRHAQLDLCTCPTSAPASTVGGWFATGGVGIGSFRYGSIGEVVQEVDVAGLDGRIVTVRGPEMELHHQTCGTLGVVTALRLACRPALPLRSFAIQLEGADGVPALLREARERLDAYSIAFSSAAYLRMRAMAEEEKPAIDRGLLALVTVTEPPGSIPDLAGVLAVAAAVGGTVLPEEVARREWEDRFYPMRIKKLGPALLVGEFYVPAAAFAEACRRIESALSGDLVGIEATAVRGDRMAVLAYLVDPGAGLLFPLRMAKALLPMRIARRLGGSAYAPGLWLASETERCLGSEKFAAYRRKKVQMDPGGLLNPGKLQVTRPRWFPAASLSWAIGIGSTLAGPISR